MGCVVSGCGSEFHTHADTDGWDKNGKAAGVLSGTELTGTNKDVPLNLRSKLGDKADSVVYWSLADETQPIRKYLFWNNAVNNFQNDPTGIICCPISVSCAICSLSDQTNRVVEMAVAVTDTSVELFNSNDIGSSEDSASFLFEDIAEIYFEKRPSCCNCYTPAISSLNIRIQISSADRMLVLKDTNPNRTYKVVAHSDIYELRRVIIDAEKNKVLRSTQTHQGVQGMEMARTVETPENRL
jgi:hypothetical protein